MRAPRSQHARKIDASFKRQIGPCTVPGKTEREDVSRLCPHAPPRWNGAARKHCVAIDPGQRERNVRTEAEAEWKRLDLDAGGSAVVAQKSVSGRERDRIHRARRAHAEATRADTPQVLNGIERVARQYFDHNSIRSILNLTRSPGAISEG